MKRIPLLFAALLLLTASALQAQNAGGLLVFHEGNLSIWDEGADTLRALDFCMPSEREPIRSNLSVSPNGTKFVFRAEPEIVTDAIERSGGIGGGELPSDIWLCDLEAETLTRVAGQPEDAALFDPNGAPDSYIVHGFPAWSPDGTRLAWTQFGSGDSPMQLVTYDLATGEATVIIEALPPQYGVPTTLTVTWGEPGIALISWEYEADSGPLLHVYAYDADDGHLIDSLDFPQGYGQNAGEGVTSIFWVENSDNDGIAMLFADNHFEVFTPGIGTSHRIPALEFYSLSAPDNAMTLVYGPFMSEENSWASRDGETFTSLPISPYLYTNLFDFGISPAGDAIAYEDTQVYVWNGEQAAAVPGTIPQNTYAGFSLAWAPVGIRAYNRDLPVLGQSGDPITCAGFMVSRLVVGERGRVSDDLPNNLRQEPASASQKLGQIPSGGEFEVLAGPVCAGGLAWWQVDYNGIVGWTAEGQDQEYWLEPLS